MWLINCCLTLRILSWHAAPALTMPKDPGVRHAEMKLHCAPTEFTITQSSCNGDVFVMMQTLCELFRGVEEERTHDNRHVNHWVQDRAKPGRARKIDQSAMKFAVRLLDNRNRFVVAPRNGCRHDLIALCQSLD